MYFQHGTPLSLSSASSPSTHVDLALYIWASHSEVDTSTDVLGENLDLDSGTGIDRDRGTYTDQVNTLNEPGLLHFLYFTLLFIGPSCLGLFFPLPY